MTGFARASKGFTLVELLIVVVIIAILSSIAVPSYQGYVVRNNRVELQSQLLQIASNLERYKSQQLTYAGVTLAMVNNNAAVFPPGPSARYNLTLTLLPNNAAPTAWTLTAAPIAGSRQAGDGALQIDNLGRRCWNPANDAGCNLADATQAWSSKAK